MQVSKVFHANCYLDGTNSLLGKFSEMKLPDIAPAMQEHKGVGMFGTLELPGGLGPLVLTAKWNGFYPDVLAASADPFTARRFQVRANVETHNQLGRIAEVPLVALLMGRWKKAGGATFKPQESGEFDDEIACTLVQVSIGGVEQYCIDVLNNIYRVGGVDRLAAMRANIGG